MLIALEAIIEKNGKVRMQKPIRLSSPCRAIVTILDEKSDFISETALLSEVALSEDWNRPARQIPFFRSFIFKTPHKLDLRFCLDKLRGMLSLLRFNSPCSALTNFAEK